ncbi:MAG TPA: N-acetyltransferase [Nitrospirae bacterium]|nr:N-acetyltransferase [Nitrospirota bacterium]
MFGKYRMIIEKRNPSTSEYLYLRNKVGWGDKEKEVTEKALNSSLYSVVAIESDQVIGMGRIIGDGGLYYYIQDLIVHPDYQNKGIGKRLMKELMNYIDEHAASGSFIGLMSATGYYRFYESFGFKARDINAPGMFTVIKKT